MLTPGNDLRVPARAQQRRAQTARALLDAAQRVLAAKGFHGATIADIARTAGVAVGTFYLYYPTKEALFTALVEDAAGRLQTDLDAVRVAVSDPIAQSRARVATFFRFAQEHRALFRIIFSDGAAVHDVVRRSQARFVDDLCDSLVHAMAHGAFRRGDAGIWAQALVGMAAYVVSWWIEQDTVAIEAVVASLSDLVLHGTLAPGTHPPLAPTT